MITVAFTEFATKLGNGLWHVLVIIKAIVESVVGSIVVIFKWVLVIGLASEFMLVVIN